MLIIVSTSNSIFVTTLFLRNAILFWWKNMINILKHLVVIKPWLLFFEQQSECISRFPTMRTNQPFSHTLPDNIEYAGKSFIVQRSTARIWKFCFSEMTYIIISTCHKYCNSSVNGYKNTSSFSFELCGSSTNTIRNM